MSISTYAELQVAVGNWINRTDLNSYIPDFIMLGEKRIYRDLRIRAMETELDDDIASGVIPVPDDYVELKSARIDGTPVQPLSRKSVDHVYNKYPLRSADGRPSVIAREGQNFIFGPYPDSGYTVKGIYYARLDALSGSNTTNWFTENAPDLLLFAALSETEIFLKNDQRILAWEAKYTNIRDQIQREDDNEGRAGGPLSASCG